MRDLQQQRPNIFDPIICIEEGLAPCRTVLQVFFKTYRSIASKGRSALEIMNQQHQPKVYHCKWLMIRTYYVLEWLWAVSNLPVDHLYCPFIVTDSKSVWV